MGFFLFKFIAYACGVPTVHRHPLLRLFHKYDLGSKGSGIIQVMFDKNVMGQGNAIQCAHSAQFCMLAPIAVLALFWCSHLLHAHAVHAVHRHPLGNEKVYVSPRHHG